MQPTHIIISFPSDKRDDLYRASDGMMIASRKACAVSFGENPGTPEHRLFLDVQKAYDWLKGLATVDIEARHSATAGETVPEAKIEERDGESRIVQPDKKLSIVAN